MSENSCSVHTPHVTCVSVHRVIRICVGVPTARGDSHKPIPSAGLFLRLPTTPTVQGGWTTCARVRRLPMQIACLSSAMASGSHGTGHGVAVGRGRSGRRLSGVGRFFRFRPLLSELELQQESCSCVYFISHTSLASWLLPVFADFERAVPPLGVGLSFG